MDGARQDGAARPVIRRTANADGNTADGNSADGNTADGNSAEGGNAEGGNAEDGNAEDGDAGDRDAGDRDAEGRTVTRVPIRRALVSVYDKTGLAELAGALAAAGVEIVSTGSTAAAIAAGGVPVTRVEDVTGFPECLDGRVKTLHPAIHAGLLADPGRPAHAEQLAGLGIAPFDLLVSGLYPFEATVAAGAAAAECIEQIDIGGPAMI